ncbi:MAG TPA: hypothetical protein VFC00_16065 [Micromonosporaceae bacterium]|nr:hypothetical protein [Micromonosporaceae bacterium]
MVGHRKEFPAEEAPCGKIVGGEFYRDSDGEGFSVHVRYYTCGCRRTRHEYHDGSVTATAVKHGRRRGKIIWEEQSDHPV